MPTLSTNGSLLAAGVFATPTPPDTASVAIAAMSATRERDVRAGLAWFRTCLISRNTPSWGDSDGVVPRPSGRRRHRWVRRDRRGVVASRGRGSRVGLLDDGLTRVCATPGLPHGTTTAAVPRRERRVVRAVSAHARGQSSSNESLDSSPHGSFIVGRMTSDDGRGLVRMATLYVNNIDKPSQLPRESLDLPCDAASTESLPRRPRSFAMI